MRNTSKSSSMIFFIVKLKIRQVNIDRGMSPELCCCCVVRKSVTETNNVCT